MINRVFGSRYRIIEKIGTGGMAEVYKAQDEVLNRTVALKVMLPQYASDQTFAARFRQEAQAAANLQSPYIVSIFDWGQDEGTYYIVMEYVRGIDLKTAIEQRGAINTRKAAEIGSQICSGLAVAHRHNIIHRDIKPQNIMVQPDGSAKIMDFGIARAGNSGMTQTGSVLGTANYVSPEQAQGKTLTPQTDLYSLGIVLYEASTGKLPFTADEPVAVAVKQVQEAPVPPMEVNPTIDPVFNAIVLKAMSKDTATRFKDADDMRGALMNYLSGRPVNIAGIDTAAATSVLMGNASSAATSVLAGNGTPATATMKPINVKAANAASYNANRTPNSSDKEKSKGKGKKVGLIIALCIVLLAAAAAIVMINLNGSSAVGTAAIPNVVGKTQADAVTALESAGFKVNVTEDYSETVADGLVISQSPTDGVEATKGSAVNISVSKGSKTANYVTIPDLTGKTVSEAEKLLSAQGLTGKSGDSVYSSTITAGQVVSQDPAAGQRVAPGTVITYTLSLGTEIITIPDVTGDSQSTATKTLESAGFVVSASEDYSSTVDSGYVISQNPTGSAAKGTTVKIVVSKGAEPVKTVSVPDLSGMTQNEANSALKSSNLSLGDVSTTSTTKESLDGTVASQNPASGKTVDINSSVDIVLYTYTPTPSGSTSTSTSTN